MISSDGPQTNRRVPPPPDCLTVTDLAVVEMVEAELREHMDGVPHEPEALVRGHVFWGERKRQIFLEYVAQRIKTL